jgi:hypothetical protein
VIRRISTASIRRREHILSFGGPLLVVALVAMWFVGLSLAAAVVIYSALGSGVRATSGETPSTFIAALFAGGSNVSILGSGGFEPYTDSFRLFYLLTALAGTAVTSLVLTYLMQVYTALLRRNTVALDVAGMEVTDDVEAGPDEYVRLRESCDAPLVRLAGLLGYTPERIDVSM